MFYAILAGFSALIVGLDQLTKWLTVRNIPFLQNIDGAQGNFLFYLTHTENTGAAWSMLEGKTWLFTLVMLVFLVAVVALVWKKVLTKPFELWCVAAIVGGGIGNLIDRLVRGSVTDMIGFSFWKSFPIFNVADCFITVGCAALLLYVLFFDRSKN